MGFDIGHFILHCLLRLGEEGNATRTPLDTLRQTTTASLFRDAALEGRLRHPTVRKMTRCHALPGGLGVPSPLLTLRTHLGLITSATTLALFGRTETLTLATSVT